MMIGLHGPLGSSKTWGLVMLAHLYQKEGFKIWSDIPLNPQYFPEYTNLNNDNQVNMEYLQKCAVEGTAFPYGDIYIMFDEWQYRADSRTSLSTDSRLFSYLYNQSRKREIVIAITSRMRGYVDLRARDAEDLIIRCFKKHKENGLKCYDHRCMKPHYFEWWIIDPENGISRKRRFMHPEPIFPMYDTRNLETGMVMKVRTN